MADGNPFDNVNPHRFFPEDVRAALWGACQLVRSRPAAFASAVAWLDKGYSEDAMRKRELYRSQRLYEIQLSNLRQGVDPYDTFRRRRALRRGTTREVLIEQTVQTALRRGARLRGDQFIITNAREEQDVLVSKENAHLVWAWADAQNRERIRNIRSEREARNAQCLEQVKSRRWRFQEAVNEAVKEDMLAGEEMKNAPRLVLLACLISYYKTDLPPLGEFASWPWKSDGLPSYALMGYLYVPGRETLMHNFEPMSKNDPNLSIAGFAADSYGGQVARAVAVLKDTWAEQDADTKRLEDSLAIKVNKPQTPRVTPRITKDEANAKAREYLRDHPEPTLRELRDHIGCSIGLVAELPVWKAAMQVRKMARPARKPKTVSFTPKMQTVTGCTDALDDLIAEQSDNYEPSPLENDPPREEGSPQAGRVYRNGRSRARS